MLTVLYRDKFGNETVFPATSVRRIRNAKAEGYPDDVLLVVTRPDEASLVYTEADARRRSTDPHEAVQPLPPGEAWPMFFVMNDAGQTVARYEL